MVKPESVLKCASLAKLRLSDDEVKSYGAQFGKVLEFFNVLSGVDTDGVVPLVTPMEDSRFLREDKMGPKLTEPEELMENAPQSKGNLFQVPPVV